MGALSVLSEFASGRPWFIKWPFLVVGITETVFYMCVALWYMVAIWGLNADSTVVVLPFLLPGFGKAFYTLGVALQYKDMPSPIVCIVGAMLSGMSCVTTIFAYVYDWPGMTRLSFFHDTDLTDLAREQSQVLAIMIFILLTPKMVIDLFSGAAYITVGVVSALRNAARGVVGLRNFRI